MGVRKEEMQRIGVTEQDARQCKRKADVSLWRPLKRPELGGAERYNDKEEIEPTSYRQAKISAKAQNTFNTNHTRNTHSPRQEKMKLLQQSM